MEKWTTPVHEFKNLPSVPGVDGPRSSSSLTDIHTYPRTGEIPVRHPAGHTDTDSKVGLPPSRPAQDSWEPAMLSRSSTLGRRQSECETVCFSRGLANGCCPPVPLPINTHGEREDRGGGKLDVHSLESIPIFWSKHPSDGALIWSFLLDRTDLWVTASSFHIPCHYL